MSPQAMEDEPRDKQQLADKLKSIRTAYKFDETMWAFAPDELLQAITAHTAQAVKLAEIEARQSELEMMKKIPLTDMTQATAAHISRRYKELESQRQALMGRDG